MDESVATMNDGVYALNRGEKPLVRNSLIEFLARCTGTHTPATRLEKREWTLSERVCENILRVCNNSDLSLYVLLLTMFKLTAARSTGEAEMTILSPGYRRDGIPAADFVVLQDQVEISRDIRSNILETRRTVVAGYAHQMASLAELHGLPLADEIVRNHPFCVSDNIHPRAVTCPSPLELRFTRRGREILCSATYDCVRLRTDLVAEFCSNLEQFIEAASSDYGVAAESVDWLDGMRRERVLGFSKGRIVSTADANLYELVSAQARNTPDAPALVHAGRSVTYAELDAIADAAAHRLLRMGIKPGDTIAVRLRSGIETVAVMLAALRSGAAFAPINPSEPVRRVSRFTEKCRPMLVVTAHSELDGIAGLETVDASHLLVRQEPHHEEHGMPDVRGDVPAYVIFTSGTSGEPKGVVVGHRGIVNAVMWKMRQYGFSVGNCVLPLFGCEFDGFILNVFAPLCSGATVVLMDAEERRLPKRIAACIAAERVTHLVTGPALYDALLKDASEDQLRCLQRVTLAGEAADPQIFARSWRAGAHIRLSNEYGPTEASVISTYHEDLAPESVNVIGSPIQNVQVYVLDARGDLLPPGAIGEIFIGGDGLAHGYAAGDTVTQDSFVHMRGERLYQTGDLGCWLPDGSLEFRGRREGYVKLLGQRVDLQEVRAAILRCPGIDDAYVLYAGDASGGVLCACVAAATETSLESVETILRQELPLYMIPSRMVRLQSLPRNAGGKVDVNALRARLLDIGAEKKAPPSNDLERRLAEIWCRVLETEQIGIDDSFFSLGGHSLRAVRLLTEIHEAFGIEMRLDQIFSANTIRRLAGIIAPGLCEHRDPCIRPLDEASVAGECALSSAQERMLALSSEHPISYNLPVLFSLEANVDLARLQFAVEAVLSRHDSLRASFHFVNDRWAQRFNDAPPVKITERALTPGIDVENVVRQVLTPFDLEKAPLLRVVLFTNEGQHAYLLFDFHHIIIDEVSLAIVLRELATFYNGEPIESAAPRSYAAYAQAQQQRRSSEEYRAQLAAVADNIRKADAEPLHLPFDYPAPRRRSHSGGVIRGELSRHVMAGARQICAESDVTGFMFFTATFALLLHKYTHQSTMVIGAPASLRSTAVTRDLVGLCLNTVPFKIAIPVAATFRKYLRGIAASMIDDLNSSEIEFDDVVTALHLDRRFGENPLFSVMLNVVDTSATSLHFKDVGARYVPTHNGTSKFDLILELDLQRGSFSFEFPVERFRESTIERLRDSFVTLLKDAIARPDAPVSALQILRPEDRQRLVDWSGCGDIGAYEEGCIASLFERQVLERPSEVALVFGEETITYGALNARSNRLAHKLRSLGCGEDEVVAVFCERSPAAIVGIMAVQKSGAAHLPLDPFYPAARTSKMLSDSGARVLISDQDVSALQFSGTVVRPDAELSGFSSVNLDIARRPESLAYVLYTSGTTGGPKGVMVAQRNLVTLVRRATSQLSIDRRDVWSLFHSLCFDVSVWEMFGALLSGSRLVIVPRDIAALPDRVLDLIETNGVTVLCQPPSAFYLLADAMVRARRPNSLRYVVLGGEAVKTEYLKEWSERYTVTLINGYGITETTVYSTFKAITAEDIRRRTGSIGRPLSGTYVYILDPDLSPCPVGVTGELYIGGLGVGRGYLGQPELTRGRFVEDPFQPGALLYRSGDLARWLPDGEIEYLCRTDTQVKLRGYRIELPEIEAAMTGYSAVRESVVLADAQGSTPQLLGFFTSAVREDLGRLRSHLEHQLPNYMVPARLIQVDRIPVTHNGKVDRKQLLADREAAPAQANRASMNSLEQLISHAWAEILGIPAAGIGTSDSFFALGGDSIGANLVARLLANRGLPIELVDLFENPILGALAGVIERRNLAGGNDGSATAAERIAYWDEMSAMEVAPLLGSENSGAAAGQLKIMVDIARDDVRRAQAAVADATELSELFLTALGLALRMWCGAGLSRAGLLETCSDNALVIAPVVLAIKDVNLGRENLASVRASVRRATNYRLGWDQVLASHPRMAAVTGGVLFHFLDVATTSSSELQRQSVATRTAASWCMLVDCCVSGDTAMVTFAVPTGTVDPERLGLLGEMFKLGLREALRAVPPPTPVRKMRISLPVQPFQDVFFRDCTYQAVLAACRYFGCDVRPALANTMAVSARDTARPRGLRVYVKYLERRAPDEVLADLGVAVSRSFGNTDICEHLVECLSEGAVGIVKLDCYFVEQQRELFQKKHGEKTVLICGYDEDVRLFEVIDNNGAAFMQYRRTKIGFDELRVAFDGYRRTFNPRSEQVISLTVSGQPGRHERALDETTIQAEALDTLRLTHEWRAEEQAALALLHEDFRAACASERMLMEHIEQFSFTLGELIMAKRLLSYQLERILEHPVLAGFVHEMVSRFEVVQNLLTKLRLSPEHAARKVQSMQTKLDDVCRFGLEYAESVGKLLGSYDVASCAR